MIAARDLPEVEKEIIRNMADCNMRATAVARKMTYHRNTIVWRLDRIEDKTGINPRSFWGLVQLIEALK